MRLGCLLPVVSLVLIIGGGQSVYTGLKNRKITEVALDALVAKKPAADWLRVRGGVLDTMNSAYPSAFGTGKATSLYVPLVPPGTDSTKTRIHVLVLTKDQALLDFTNELREMEKSKADDATAAQAILRNIDKTHVARPVEGVVQFGIEADDRKTRKIRELYDNLADDAIILEEGAKPSTGKGIAMLLGGLVLGVLLVRSSARKGAAAAPPPP